MTPPAHIRVAKIPPQADQDAALASLLCSLEELLDDEVHACLRQSVFEREESFPTYLENGLAVPHGRVERLDDPLVVVGLHPEGVHWPDADHKARLIILLGVPSSMIGGYLQLIQKLMRWHKQSELIGPDGVVTDIKAIRRELEETLR